ncbi:hypothetical protein [Streptosporangium roseum]|uniref:hypothetical protein n=1 Tax=Streptosporangium roseum TaxID=2001 RepID=UPI0001A3DFF1|nr:hypothetical protein [Streptosporangium roseum]
MRRLREAATEFTFALVLGLVGFGVIFGMSALFGLPWLVDVLATSSVPRVIGLLALLALLGFAVFVARLVRKVGKRRHQPAE